MKYLIIILFLFVTCKQKHLEVKKQQKLVYTPVSKNILYKDSANNIYLKVTDIFIGTDSLYDSYLKDVSLKDSTLLLKDVVDIPTFNYFQSSEKFYIDKNYIYVYQNIPSTFTPFIVLEIKKDKAKLLEENYIKDDENVYWQARKVPKADAKTFVVYNKEESLGFALDKNSIYKDGQKLTIADSSYFPNKIKDSIIDNYFKN